MKSVDVPCFCKKSRFGQKKLVCHGRKSRRFGGRLRGSQAARPFRLSPGGRSRPKLQAQALRLRVSGSLSLSPSLSISLSRGSLPESPRRLSPSHQAHHVTRRRASDHSKLKAPGRPAPPPRAASLITIVMIHGKLE